MYLHEQLLLISARRTTSKIKVGKAATDAGFLSAILFDLYLNKRILFQDKMFQSIATGRVESEVLQIVEECIADIESVANEFSVLIAELLPFVSLLKKKCINRLVENQLIKHIPRTEYIFTDMLTIYGLQKWNEIYKRIEYVLVSETVQEINDLILAELSHTCDLYLNYYDDAIRKEQINVLTQQCKNSSKWENQFHELPGLALIKDESKFIILSTTITSITGFEMNFTDTGLSNAKLVRKPMNY